MKLPILEFDDEESVINKNSYFYIGSFNVDANREVYVNSKIAFYDKVNSADKAELSVHLRHGGVENVWTSKILKVSASNVASRFHLIEISATEIQLWVQIASTDMWHPMIYTIYGDELVYNPTPAITYGELPTGADTVGSYDAPQHCMFGICETAADVAEKVVTVSNEYWNITVGSLVTVKFQTTNTASNPTLNVNNTGAYPIIYDISAISDTKLIYAGSESRYITYMFTGMAYVFISWSVSDSYRVATTTEDGLMSASDKVRLESLSAGLSNTTYTPTLTSGIEIGTLSIDANKYKLYAPECEPITYSDMTGATNSTDGASGLVPAPSAGKQESYLRGDGTWSVPTDTTYNEATTSKAGLMSKEDKSKLDGITVMTGATSGANGASGLVPAPNAGDQNKFLCANGSWSECLDEKVRQVNTTAAADYRLMLTASNNDMTEISDTCKSSKFTANPSTGVLASTSFKGDLDGNAARATSATRDASDQTITTTYIKSLSASGNTITFTKGDGNTTGTVNVSCAKSFNVTVTVSDWTENVNGGYSCTKTVSGILAADEIIADVMLSSDVEAAKLQIASWACVCNGNIYNSADNTVDFYCYDTVPSVDLTIRLTVVR